MQNTDSMIPVAVIWRGSKYVVEIDSIASIKDLGDELQKLTGVKADTMKLIVSQFSGKISKLLSPFSDEHSGLSLLEVSIVEDHGEEISVHLWTDDLKGFRKYESIKRTLLHELAHLVYSDHDANFYALDKQLNQEANALDLTKSREHTLARVSHLDNLDEEFDVPDNRSLSQKLGGNVSDQLTSACTSSVATAYWRLANSPVKRPGGSDVHEEPDPDDSRFNEQNRHNFTDAGRDSMATEMPDKNQLKADNEPDPDEHSCDTDKHEADPDDSHGNHCQVMEILNGRIDPSKIADECNPDDLGQKQDKVEKRKSEKLVKDAYLPFERMEEQEHLERDYAEPDSDESCDNKDEPDPDESRANNKPDHHLARTMEAKQRPYEDLLSSQGVSSMQIDEPDPDDQELRRIQDPVKVVCERPQKAVELLRAEANTQEAIAVLQTLFKIISNVIEHPDEVKYKRLRKLQWKSCRQLDLAKTQSSVNLESLKLI